MTDPTWIDASYSRMVIGKGIGSGISGTTLFRVAAWVDPATVPDIFDTAVQSKFWAGGLLVDPADSVAAYGTPLVDLYGIDGHADGQSGITYLNGSGAYAARGPGHYGSWDGGTFATITGSLGVAA